MHSSPSPYDRPAQRSQASSLPSVRIVTVVHELPDDWKFLGETPSEQGSSVFRTMTLLRGMQPLPPTEINKITRLYKKSLESVLLGDGVEQEEEGPKSGQGEHIEILQAARDPDGKTFALVTIAEPDGALLIRNPQESYRAVVRSVDEFCGMVVELPPDESGTVATDWILSPALAKQEVSRATRGDLSGLLGAALLSLQYQLDKTAKTIKSAEDAPPLHSYFLIQTEPGEFIATGYTYQPLSMSFQNTYLARFWRNPEENIAARLNSEQESEQLVSAFIGQHRQAGYKIVDHEERTSLRELLNCELTAALKERFASAWRPEWKVSIEALMAKEGELELAMAVAIQNQDLNYIIPSSNNAHFEEHKTFAGFLVHSDLHFKATGGKLVRALEKTLYYAGIPFSRSEPYYSHEIIGAMLPANAVQRQIQLLADNPRDGLLYHALTAEVQGHLRENGNGYEGIQVERALCGGIDTTNPEAAVLSLLCSHKKGEHLVSLVRYVEGGVVPLEEGAIPVAFFRRQEKSETDPGD